MKGLRSTVIFFSGLSGAGKSTLSTLLKTHYESQGQAVTCLDGDILRGLLSSDLGFSRRDRELNLQRAAYVAGEVVSHGGLAICAMIAPYHQARQQAREYIENKGGCFVEVYLNTPLTTCEARDPKGMYAQARKGVIKDFTGVDSPFEAPESPDITINTAQQTQQQSLHYLLTELEPLLNNNIRLVSPRLGK